MPSYKKNVTRKAKAPTYEKKVTQKAKAPSSTRKKNVTYKKKPFLTIQPKDIELARIIRGKRS